MTTYIKYADSLKQAQKIIFFRKNARANHTALLFDNNQVSVSS